MLNQHLQELEAKKKVMRDEYMRSLLNKKEAAQELGGISVSTLDRMRQDGLIVSRKVRGKIMFSIDEIARFQVEVY